jgi:hypothetical protein
MPVVPTGTNSSSLLGTRVQETTGFASDKAFLRTDAETQLYFCSMSPLACCLHLKPIRNPLPSLTCVPAALYVGGCGLLRAHQPSKEALVGVDYGFSEPLDVDFWLLREELAMGDAGLQESCSRVFADSPATASSGLIQDKMR